MTLSGPVSGPPPFTHTDSAGFYSFNGIASASTYSVTVSSTAPCSFSQQVHNNVSANSTQNFTISDATGCAIGLPSAIGPLDARYAPHVFSKTFQYDPIDRIIGTSTGADIPELTASGSQINVGYDFRGIINSVTSSYGNNGGVLLANALADATGAITSQTFGDAAQTSAIFGYDNNKRLTSYTLGRFPGAWTSSSQPPPTGSDPNTRELTLANLIIVPDRVGNPQSISDVADPSEWPAGSKPASQRIFTYLDDYRLKDATAKYAGGATADNDVTASPYTAQETSSGLYRTPASSPNRPRDQSFTYDWRGNITSSGDDANVFFDRSVGTVTSGPATGAPGPDQIASSTRGGAQVQVLHDAAGNITSITNTATNTVYTYGWDELGRLATATRAEGGHNAVQDQFAYDCFGARVRTTQQLFGSSPRVDHTVQVFDSLTLLHAGFPAAPGDYERDTQTEHLYLGVGGVVLGHAFYAQTSLPSASSGKVHVFMPLGDPLGSTSFVIDHDTGELVERSTYQPYGGVESDYRPARWASFREDIRYTGHFDNAEVGLVYFGARYYSPQLGRFISPDPLTIHGLAGDPNPYAFVGGSPIANVDPFGLDPEGAQQQANGAGSPAWNAMVAAQDAAVTAQNNAEQAAAGDAMSRDSTAEPDLGGGGGPRGGGNPDVPNITGAPSGPATNPIIVGGAAAAYGFAQGGAPFGMLTSVLPVGNPGQPRAFGYWHGVGQFLGGLASFSAGVGGLGGGLLAEVPSGGTSTAVVVGSWALVANGVIGMGAGLTQLAMTARGGGRAATGRDSNGRITDPSGRGLQHATDRHTVGGLENVNASTFNQGEDLGALVRNAEGVAATPQTRGNFQTIVNAGRTIGIDRATGAATQTYTVITTPSGGLVTLFPGVP